MLRPVLCPENIKYNVYKSNESLKEKRPYLFKQHGHNGTYLSFSKVWYGTALNDLIIIKQCVVILQKQLIYAKTLHCDNKVFK